MMDVDDEEKADDSSGYLQWAEEGHVDGRNIARLTSEGEEKIE